MSKQFKLINAVVAGLFYVQVALSQPSVLSQSEYREMAVGILKDSVAYQSFAGTGQVRPLARMLEKKFLQAGFDRSDVHYLDVEPEVAALVVR